MAARKDLNGRGDVQSIFRFPRGSIHFVTHDFPLGPMFGSLRSLTNGGSGLVWA